MAYVTGNIPVGALQSERLANLGIGHQALDAGGGYTYFNPQTGYEFSSVVGLTYNFENTHTQYQNGVDLHWDMGASRFVTKEWQIGAVGYVYQQLSCDSGAGDRVGCFKSRVMGIGPQIGHIFQVGEHHQGYLNLKGYKEFARAAPSGRLERVAHAVDLAEGAGSSRATGNATDRQVALVREIDKPN